MKFLISESQFKVFSKQIISYNKTVTLGQILFSQMTCGKSQSPKCQVAK